ncbi:MAG: diguanylate cyclase [Polyangiaceae bacterium]|jgi:two-component system, cell cycle response regulator
MLDVLIAEDDSDLREMLAGCVAGLGYRVHEAADGEAALEILGTTPIDILLTDWMMPRLDGFTLCSRVKIGASPPYVILMTAFGPARLVEGIRAGADDFLTKPINLDVLDVRLLAASRHIHTQQRLVDLNAKLRRDSERSLAIARSDPLTGLGNRLALDKELRRISANAARYMSSLSIAMCDIDYFKHYNDRYGHLAGDIALKRVAATVLETVRAGDLVFRYGGEEFLVILPEQSVTDAVKAMERVRAAVQALAIRHPTVSRTGTLTLSVGVASLRKDAEDCLARADRALYRAKADQRNCVRSDPDEATGSEMPRDSAH